MIVKPRTTNDFWVCYHSAFNDLSKYIVLNSANAVGTAAANYWGTSSDWTSTTFGVYPAGGANNNLVGVSTVAYCFAPVEGYSAFGSYETSTALPFVYTGFSPRWILIKNMDTSNDWIIYDTERNSYNESSTVVAANLSTAESGFTGGYNIDILSNGFKIRTASSGAINSNTHIYAAFAEHPFKNSRAR